jgi:hypothetical protein
MDAGEAAAGGKPDGSLAILANGRLIAPDAFAGEEAVGAVEAEPVGGRVRPLDAVEEIEAGDPQDSTERSAPEVVPVKEECGDAFVGESAAGVEWRTRGNVGVSRERPEVRGQRPEAKGR